MRHAGGLQTEHGVSFNINLFTPGDSNAADSLTGTARRLSPIAVGGVICPSCNGDVALVESKSGWQTCPYCQKRLQIRVWGAVQQNTNAAAALSDQATCFFHPDKALGVLPAVRPLCVRVVRFAIGSGARLPNVFRARAR